MSKHNKDLPTEEPIYIHLGNDEDEYDDDEVEVIRPHARVHDSSTKGRDLHSQSVEEVESGPSKTSVKKQMHDLRDIGKELTELSKEQIAQLDIPDSLREALHEFKSIHKFGAQRRQIQYIGKLMREIDPAPILAKLNAWKGKSQQHTAYMHLLERWRDRLMASDHALTDLIADHPNADAQHLRNLIRNAHKEIEANKPPKNYREIFQALKEIIPEQQYKGTSD